MQNSIKQSEDSNQTQDKKQFLQISDLNSKFFRDFKERVKKEKDVFFTYNKILSWLIECRDDKKLEAKIKAL